MKKLIIAAFTIFMASGVGWAAKNDIDLTQYQNFAQDIVQGEFARLSEETGLGLNFIPMAPAEPGGLSGFDLGLELTALDIDENALFWKYAVREGNPPSYFPIPKIHFQKGLPLRLDIGAVYSFVPNSNIQFLGAEAKWAFIEGSSTVPALALRASYTKLLGVPYLNFQTERIDLSISKGIFILTPYAGIGGVFTQSEPVLPQGFSRVIKEESISDLVGYLGFRLSLGLLRITLEADFSKIPSYSGKLSLGI